jgi:hypothetical protein
MAAVGTNTALSAIVRHLAWLVCLLGVTACDGGPSGPTVDLNERFTLAVGETATIDSPRTSLEFVEVSGDSRCPADAICIQGGDAVVRVRATVGATSSTLELHTGDSSGAFADFQGLRVQLQELQPYPFSSRAIAKGDYKATLTVTQP